MTETPKGDSPSETTEPATGASDEWNSGQAGQSGSTAQPGREWLTQLQTMIDNLATAATPVMRDVAAKAAELAAAAGEKAGPIAHRAAEATEAAGHKLAERGREVAAELRRDANGGAGGATSEGAAAGDRPNSIDSTKPGP